MANTIDISAFLNDSPQLYASLLTAKNGSVIPLFASGKTMESRYNPQNDAIRFAETVPLSSFYIVLGIGSGIGIEALLNKYPASFFLCLEKDEKEINFLMQIPQVKKLQNISHIKFTTIEKLSDSVQTYYLPAIYGGLYVVEQGSWIKENEYLYPLIQRIIKTSINTVSADFSAQSHFGKIWQNNILNNLKTYSAIKPSPKHLPADYKSKTAAIIAAGPTLEKTITELITNREDYYIISTDTAYSSLQKKNIIPDAVLSIDGQNISHAHFLEVKLSGQSPLFIFDLCSDSSAVRHISKQTDNILFSVSGHPFSELIYTFSPESFIKLYSGSGTVTIAALDFAVKCGFTKLQVFGADFAYSNGKAYTKGTYLDKVYSCKSTSLESMEKQFSRLLYRTELMPLNNKTNTFTTSVLDSYRLSFEQYLQANNYSFTKENDKYIISITENYNQSDFPSCLNNYDQIIKKISDLASKSQDFDKKTTLFDLNNLDISLLPLISALRFYDNNNSSFQTFLKKAYQLLSRILNQYEK